MSSPPADLPAVVGGHRTLEQLIVDLSDEQARRPSLLPGWSIGHVLTHLARNADSLTGIFAAAARGEVADQYPGGVDQRNGDIEAGAGRPAGDLIADVGLANDRLEAAWAASDWVGSGRTMVGELDLPEVLMRRWREVAVHTVDLGLGYGWDDLPERYVRLELPRLTMVWSARMPMGLTELPAKALAVTPRQRLAWLLGRAAIAGLDPAGIY